MSAPVSIEIDPAILYWGTPVTLISTLNDDGTANLAPMSSVWWLGWGCMLGMTESSQTVVNMRRTGECVLNLPSAEQVDNVNAIAGTTGANPVPPDKRWLGFTYEPDKFGRAGMTAIESLGVAPPRAAECPVQMEATVATIHDFGANNPLVPMKVAAIEVHITAVHAHPEILMNGSPHKVDPDRWKPLIMSFRQFYTLTNQTAASRLADIPEDRWRPRPPRDLSGQARRDGDKQST